MPQFIVGDSYGDVGNRVLQTDAQNDARFFNWLAANRAQQEMADKARTGAENLQLSYDQLAAARDNQNASLDYQNRALSQNADLFGKQLSSNEKLANLQLLSGDKRIERADSSQAYNEAYNAINKGDVTTPDELQALVGDRLTPTQKVQLNTYLGSMFTRRQTAYDEGERSRQLLDNQYQQRIGTPYLKPVEDLRQQAQTAIPDAQHHFWQFRTPTREGLLAKADALEKSNQLSQQPEEDRFFKAMNQSQRLGKLVDFDPTTHSFVNLIPRPTPFGTHGGAAGPLSAASGPPIPGVADQYRSPIGPSLETTWISVPSIGIKVNPMVMANIRRQAASLPTDADRYGFMNQAFKKALATGDAVKLTSPAPAAPDTTANYRGVANLNLPYF